MATESGKETGEKGKRAGTLWVLCSLNTTGIHRYSYTERPSRRRKQDGDAGRQVDLEL